MPDLISYKKNNIPNEWRVLVDPENPDYDTVTEDEEDEEIK